MKKPLSMATALMLDLSHRYAVLGRMLSATSLRSAKRTDVPMAALLRRLKAMPDVRHDLVNRIRGEIARGDYETPAKLDAAVEALADDLAMGR